MMFRKIWNWIKRPYLPDGVCAACGIVPPCKLCWTCVGFFFMITAFLSLIYSLPILGIVMFVIGMVSFTLGLTQIELEGADRKNK